MKTIAVCTFTLIASLLYLCPELRMVLWAVERNCELLMRSLSI